MSIAELIMTGTNRASESTAWVGDSLAKLGQNVGQALAQREQQKQAQEMLPMLQQSIQESMSLAQTGDTAGAYSNMMGIFASNPNLMQNKAVLPFLEMGLKGIDESANTFKDKERFRIQEGMYNARYGDRATNEVMLSGAQAAEQAVMGMEDQADFTQLDEMSGLPVMEAPTTPEERAAQLGAEGQPFKMQQPAMAGPTREAAAAQRDFAKLPTYKQASVANVAGFNALPPQQKVQAANQSVAFDPGASKYEEAKVDLGEYGIDIGSIGVPKVNEQVRIKMTASGTNDDPTVRKTFSQDFVKVGEQQYKDNQEFISKVRSSSSKLSKERPAADLPTFKEIFQKNGGILNATLAPAPEGEYEGEKSKFPFVLIPRQGATPIPITETQYEMIQTIQTVPAIADSTGLNLSASKNLQKAEIKKLSPKDQQALDWANANSNDPRANQIKQRLGI
jgi:hypothetical protein